IDVTLQVTNGTLTLPSLTGLTVTAGTNGSSSFTIHGTLATINARLDGLIYTPTANYNGSATLTILTNDLGNTGTGGAMTDTDAVALTVYPVDDAPVNTVPAATQHANEDTTLVLSGANAVSVADIDAGSAVIQVSLSVANAVLTL